MLLSFARVIILALEAVEISVMKSAIFQVLWGLPAVVCDFSAHQQLAGQGLGSRLGIVGPMLPHGHLLAVEGGFLSLRPGP